MAKRLLAGLLTASLVAGLLVGCGTKDAGGQDVNATPETAENTSDEQSGDSSGQIDHIIMTYLTIGFTSPDLGKVQDAINEISREEIGVEVELKDISIPDTFSNYSLWIGSGEQVDLMQIAFQGIGNYVSSGQLLPLDDYLTNQGQYLKSLTDEFPLTDGAVINGQTYGIQPVMPCYGFRGGMVLRDEYFTETGAEVKNQYTWDEITDILTKIKENHSDCYPYAVLGSSVGSTATNYGFFAELDNCGSTCASGSVLNSESTTIENVFATEGYKNYLLMMRDWYEKGLIMPDAATTDATITELVSSGKCAGYFMNVQPVQAAGWEPSFGFGGATLNVTEGYYPSVAASAGTYWTIPITSAHPEAAMKFLNLMTENVEVARLLKSGIEGEHYVKTDDELMIAYPEGVNADNVTYNQPLGLFGDRRYEYSFTEGVSVEENNAWTENNKKNTYKVFGYNYDSSNMTNQLIAVNTVLDQYLPSLETGSVENVEEIYEQFLGALETAGINDIIADNQAQLDQWLANN